MLAQLLLYAGAALLVGGVAVRHLVTPVSPRLRWLPTGLLLLVAGAVWKTQGVLRELDMLNLTDTLDFLTRVPSGRAALLLVIGACVLLAAHLSRFSRLTELGAAALTLWGLAGLGHGATHGAFVRFVHVLHGGAMSVWVVGVATLLLIRPRQVEALKRFSPVAAGCVGVLISSGLIMTSSHTGSFLRLPDTLYGQRLILKLLVFGVVLGMAFVVRRALMGQARASRGLGLEFFLLLVILWLTSSLVGLAPPSHGSLP